MRWPRVDVHRASVDMRSREFERWQSHLISSRKVLPDANSRWPGGSSTAARPRAASSTPHASRRAGHHAEQLAARRTRLKILPTSPTTGMFCGVEVQIFALNMPYTRLARPELRRDRRFGGVCDAKWRIERASASAPDTSRQLHAPRSPRYPSGRAASSTTQNSPIPE